MSYAEAYKWYAAQVIPQIDAEIAGKGHFWMETKSYLDKTFLKGHGGHAL